MSLKLDVWIEQDGDRIRVRYRDHRGKKISYASYASKREANKGKQACIDKLKREHFNECDPALPTKQAYDRWLVAARSGLSNKKGIIIKESTIETWGWSLKAVLEEAKTIGLLDEQWVKDYIARMMALDYEQWTIHRRLVDLKSFLNWCRREKLITWDAFENIPISIPEAVARFYSDEELDRFEWAAKDNDVMRLWLRCGYLAGLRHKEVAQAQRHDIRWLPDGSGEGEMTVWGWQSKNRMSRTIPLGKEVMDAAGTLRQGPLVPVWSEGKFLYEFEALKVKADIKEPPNWYSKRFKSMRSNKDASLTQAARFHDFRHTFCKIFLQEGGDISRLHKITGHKSLDVLVKIYGHFETKHLHESVRAIANRRRLTAGQWRGKIDIINVNSGQAGSQGITKDDAPQDNKAMENTSDFVIPDGKIYNCEN